MKKIYLQPKLNVVEIKMDATLLGASTIVTKKSDVPTDIDPNHYDPQDNGIKNGWGEWEF